jgi:hypothetical protein
MLQDDIEKFANLDTTPKFFFDSDELARFHRERRSASGHYVCYSDACVVKYRSLIDGSLTYVLSFLDYGQVVPRHYDLQLFGNRLIASNPVR